jgi:hypothetical protein
MRAMRLRGPAKEPLRVACIGALAIVVLALAAWRAWCVLSGPDVDTDAYAHHMIARAILADPHDLAVHWVWLPLFHYAQVPLVALGGTMNAVRWINVALSAAVPIVLFAYVRRTSSDVVALLAAVIAAACPIAMQMGTTAQPEPLFALVVLGVAIAFEEMRYAAASLMLGAAVMLRYEAWAALLAIAAILVLEPLWRRRVGLLAEPPSRQKWLVIAVPAALILVWAVLRRPVDGRWFGFLRDTRSFANDALHETSALDRGVVVLARDILYYPVYVPARVLGVVLLLVPFGVVRTLRSQGVRFVSVFVACLAFVSFTWVMRSSLGLDRHFVCIVPLYATFAAQGAAAIASSAARAGGRRVGQALAAGLAGVALVGLALHLDLWMGQWRASIVRSWPDRLAVGAYLRGLPEATRVYCDDATVEILSGLDRRRFDRHWMDDPHTWDVVADDARASRSPVYIATWRRKLRGHEAEGDIVLRAVEPGIDPSRDDVGLAVMRVSPPSAMAQP